MASAIKPLIEWARLIVAVKNFLAKTAKHRIFEINVFKF